MLEDRAADSSLDGTSTTIQSSDEFTPLERNPNVALPIKGIEEQLVEVMPYLKRKHSPPPLLRSKDKPYYDEKPVKGAVKYFNHRKGVKPFAGDAFLLNNLRWNPAAILKRYPCNFVKKIPNVVGVLIYSATT